MDQRTPRRREKRLNQIRTVTKKRILNMFDEADVAYIAQQGPQWSWRSGVPRFQASCMTGNTPTEVSRMEHIGPGVYRMPSPRVINLHLSKQPRFQLDATTADVRTELQLPGTEHIGPGYYPKTDPPIRAYMAMKSPVGRFESDPQNTKTEQQMNPLTGPGYNFVPQYHLFWSEDGSPKVSDNIAVKFGTGQRFSEGPEELEKRRWAETQGALIELEEHYRKLTWESTSHHLPRVPRFMGHSPLQVHHNLPNDSEAQNVPLQGHTQLQKGTHERKCANHLKKGARAARSAVPKTPPEGPSPLGSLAHFNKKLLASVSSQPNAHSEIKFRKGVSARAALSDAPVAQATFARRAAIRSKSALNHTSSPATSPKGTARIPPRCASHIYSRRLDRSPVPVHDGFLGIDKEMNRFTVDFRTSDNKNPYLAKSTREPESNLLHIHQPNILTNGIELGPGTYLGPAQFGAGDADQIAKVRSNQEEAWREFKTGCKKHNEKRDQEAQHLIQGKSNRILWDLVD